MTLLLVFSVVVLVCAAVPATLFVVNLRLYRAPRESDGSKAHVAVLVPARDEERNIGACIASVLASEGVTLDVYVLDDASQDRTAEIVRELAAQDARVRLVQTQSLPAGWNGKQRACWLLAQQASAPLLLFLDADVRLAPDAIAHCAAEMQATGTALLSGFPRQITVGWMERMLLPLVHFVLLGFLPIAQMRRSTGTAYSAGCGQFFLSERGAYFASGGHAAIRETRHDGLRLPQAFRRHGYNTDIVDLTELAEVRMYESASAVWTGLAKNATEGIAAPARIVPLTVLLFLGQVLPFYAATLWVGFYVSSRAAGVTFGRPIVTLLVGVCFVLAAVASYLPRLLALRRFKQPRMSALFHPAGILLLLLVQWYALGKQVFGRPVAWRSRSYASGSGEEVR